MLSKSLTSRLKDPTLLRDAVPIGGRWVEPMGQGGLSVTNPADGDLLAVLPDLGPQAAREAIDAAQRAQPGWAARTGKDRAGILRRLFDLMIVNLDDLATILTLEMGKPYAEARSEIAYAASFIEWFAEEAKRVYGDTIPGHHEDKRILVIKQPVGVVAAITPWNFPSAMVTRKLGPALAAGCAMVLKPASETPLSAIALAVLAERAGLPAGLLSIVVGTQSAAIGAEFCSNEMVRKITFTGSTEVGRILMRQASGQVKRLSLELGGNAPFIVFDDADVDAAVEGALAAKFRNAGQTCVCANRLYVQSRIHDVFVERFVKRVSDLAVGDGFDPGVSIGPLIDANAVAKATEHIADAEAKGASIAIDGRQPNRAGNFLAPTVLVGVDKRMRVAREETFGPVAPVFRFEDEQEVVSLANDTEFGLAAYFYARDVSRVWRVAEALQYGIVGINTGLISTEVAPFGGIKQSGFGKEGSHYGIDDYLNLKYLCLSI